MSSNRTTLQQDRQINSSNNYNDNLVTGATLQTNTQNIQDDLNALRTMIKSITGESNWYLAPSSPIVNTAAHENLDTLVHNISENSFIKTTRTLGKINNITIWDSPGMLIKIREFLISRSNNKVSQVIAKQYNNLGATVMTLTQNITRDSSGRVESVSCTEV